MIPNYDEMDPECVELCEVLNQLPGITTYESCSGHHKRPLSVFFSGVNLQSVSLLGRCTDPRYGDGKIFITLSNSDSHHNHVIFELRSKNIGEEAYKSAKDLCLNIKDHLKNKAYREAFLCGYECNIE